MILLWTREGVAASCDLPWLGTVSEGTRCGYSRRRRLFPHPLSPALCSPWGPWLEFITPSSAFPLVLVYVFLWHIISYLAFQLFVDINVSALYCKFLRGKIQCFTPHFFHSIYDDMDTFFLCGGSTQSAGCESWFLSVCDFGASYLTLPWLTSLICKMGIITASTP